MASAVVRFFGPLNDFLPASRRQASLLCTFKSAVSVKDLAEAIGVPHPEIDLLVVNGQVVDFGYLLHDGDHVTAYPPFCQLDLADTVRLGPPPQTVPRFVADVHLGRLSAYLRLAGVDTRYRNDYSDRELVEISSGEDRTVLTRDVGVLKHSRVSRGYFLRETSPARQLVEVLRRFDLVARATPFSRCLRCNELLRAVSKDRVEHLLPERTREHFRDFSRCPSCARIYWQGTHYARMRVFLDAAFSAAGAIARARPV